MPDEPITIRGGSLTVDCDNGKKQLVQDVGNRHRHPSENGSIKSVEYREGEELLGILYVREVTDQTQIIIHYDVDAGSASV